MSEFVRVNVSESADDAYQMVGAKQTLGQDETEPETRVVVTHVRDAARTFMSGSDDVQPESGLEPYRDMQQATNAMLDKRYSDPEAHAYRADVKERIRLMMRLR